ncbi:BsuPI-related putative proteinase inhibitor [Exiguobacterium flavidum]|uniref:BsuPI-related putative proteinase inhibitor n=1 Tax=Exiguobacterium flavidum TaxID=2184695 RepID=UPI000DF81152|nr:BsuPI-related putative proteinase inhibitor [Exiguobacterium flavidum]
MRRLTSVLLASSLLFAVGCGKETEEKTAGKSEPVKPIAISVAASIEEDGTIDAKVTLTNENEKKTKVTFNSSQRFELRMLDEEEQEVYLYSKDQSFTQALEEETWQAGEAKSYDVEIKQDFEPGVYQLEATSLAAAEGAPEISMIDRQTIKVEKQEVVEAPVEEADQPVEETEEQAAAPQTKGDFRDVVIKKDGEGYLVTGKTDQIEFEWSIPGTDKQGSMEATTGTFEVRLNMTADEMSQYKEVVLQSIEGEAQTFDLK